MVNKDLHTTRMSKLRVQTRKISLAVLFCTSQVRLPVIIAPPRLKFLSAPIGIVWLRAYTLVTLQHYNNGCSPVFGSATFRLSKTVLVILPVSYVNPLLECSLEWPSVWIGGHTAQHSKTSMVTSLSL